MANRIELTGFLIGKPEIRVTPAGTPVFRTVVDCGEDRSAVMLELVMVGDAARETSARLREGGRIYAVGSLRAVAASDRRSTPGLQVIATEVRPDP